MITWHLSLSNEDLLRYYADSLKYPNEYTDDEKNEIKKEILSRMNHTRT